jgi:hypothetical protein
MLKIDVKTVKSVKIVGIKIYLKAYKINLRLIIFLKISLLVNKYSYMNKVVLNFYLISKNKNFITLRFSKKVDIFKVLYLNENRYLKLLSITKKKYLRYRVKVSSF